MVTNNKLVWSCMGLESSSNCLMWQYVWTIDCGMGKTFPLLSFGRFLACWYSLNSLRQMHSDTLFESGLWAAWPWVMKSLCDKQVSQLAEKHMLINTDLIGAVMKCSKKVLLILISSANLYWSPKLNTKRKKYCICNTWLGFHQWICNQVIHCVKY